jgi:hypothetical protein
MLADGDVQRPLVISQIEIGPADRIVGEIDFGAIAETAGDRALRADIGAADAAGEAATVALAADARSRRIEIAAVDLHPAARLEAPAACGLEFGCAFPADLDRVGIGLRRNLGDSCRRSRRGGRGGRFCTHRMHLSLEHFDFGAEARDFVGQRCRSRGGRGLRLCDCRRCEDSRHCQAE